MENTESSNLTRLLRLLADAASAADVPQLQANMREDALLKMQYDKLIQVTTQPFSVEQSLLHINEIDPDLIAAFIDGGLSHQERIVFERQCWNSDSLLREVATIWRIEFESANTGDSVSAIDSVDSPEIASSPESDAVATSLKSVVPYPVIDENSPRPATPIRPKRRFGARMFPTFVAAAVVAAILIGSWRFVNFERNRLGIPNEDQIVQQDPKTSDSRSEQVVQDDRVRDRELDKERVPEADPDSSLRPMKQPNEVIVNVPDANQPEPNLGPLPLPKPGILKQSPKEISNLAAWLAWFQVGGIAATKDESNDKWRGILSPNNYVSGKAIPWSQVATLDASQLKGDAKDGSKWTADSNTSFRISQRRNSPAGTVVCELLSGRIAVTNLEAGQTLYFKFNNQDFKVDVDEADTQLVVYRDARELTLGIFGGAVRSGTEEINRRVWKKIDSAGTFTTFRPSEYDAWYNDSIRKETAPATLRQTLNAAPDFLAQAIDIGRTGTDFEKSIASQAVLQCSAADKQLPSDQRLQSMIGQQASEAVRASLVEWLVKQYIKDPAFGQQLVQKICKLQQVPAEEERELRSWLNFAARQQQYTRQTLSQLLGSLTQETTLIIRQTAKYFLEQYVGEPLDFYQAGKPGPVNNNRAINVVKQKVEKRSNANRK